MSIMQKGGNRTTAHALQSDWSVGSTVITFNQQTQTALTGHPKQKNFQAVLTHDKMDSEFTDFLDDYLVEDADAANAGNYEDGSARGSTGNDPTTLVLARTYSGKNTSSGKRLVYTYAARCISGGDHTLQNSTTESTATLQAVAADEDIEIPSTAWESSLVDTSDTGLPTFIAAGSYGRWDWIDYVS